MVLSPLYTMSHDQSFKNKCCGFLLVMVFGQLTMPTRNPQPFYLTALNHVCRMALNPFIDMFLILNYTLDF